MNFLMNAVNICGKYSYVSRKMKDNLAFYQLPHQIVMDAFITEMSNPVWALKSEG